MSDNKGIIYILSNPAMPDMVKVEAIRKFV